MQARKSRMGIVRTWSAAVAAAALAATVAGCNQSTANVRAASMQAGGDGILKIGVVLESTGDQKFLNDSQRAAVKLAVKDINDAGGFEGSNVQLLPAQAGEAAAVSAQDFINGGADVVIGPTDSSSAPVAIDLLSEASVAIISPANSAAALSNYPSNGYYFRTFPSTVLEGQALAEQVQRASAQEVVILHGKSTYASTVTGTLQDELAAQGITSKRIPLADGLPIAAQEAGAAGAGAVVVVAREQVRELLTRLMDTGIQPSTLFLGSGGTAAYGDAFAKGALDGVHGLLAGSLPSGQFQHRLLEVAPELEHLTFAAEAYDAVVLAVLAAADAGDDAGSSIAGHLLEVSGNHQHGTANGAAPQQCTSYAACLALLVEGKAIDYQGQSGPVTFNDNGDIRTAGFSVYEYGGQNLPQYSGTVRVSLSKQSGL